MEITKRIQLLASSALDAYDMNITNIAGRVTDEQYEKVIGNPSAFLGCKEENLSELASLVSSRELVIMWSEIAQRVPEACLDEENGRPSEIRKIYLALSEEFGYSVAKSNSAEFMAYELLKKLKSNEVSDYAIGLCKIVKALIDSGQFGIDELQAHEYTGLSANKLKPAIAMYCRSLIESLVSCNYDTSAYLIREIHSVLNYSSTHVVDLVCIESVDRDFAAIGFCSETIKGKGA